MTIEDCLQQSTQDNKRLWVKRKLKDLVSIRRKRDSIKNDATGSLVVDLDHMIPSTGRLSESEVRWDSTSFRTVFYEGDVLFGRLRAYLAKYWLADRDGLCSTEIWAMVSDQSLIWNTYLAQVVSTDSFLYTASICYGTHMPRSDWKVVSEQFIILPPLPEQAAIAKVLSDTDDLIENLEKLIAKKRAIKQGVMQQLLTGKRRLPGFTGEWERKRLGEIASVNKGVPVPDDLIEVMGNVPYLNGGTDPSGFITMANTKSNSIAISEGGNSCGHVQYVKTAYWCGGHCYSVLPLSIENSFLYYALKILQPSIMALRVGSGLPNVQKPALKGLALLYPIEKNEQIAIGDCLKTFDEEIEQIELKVLKMYSIKQGMMQTLLTGKIRLPLDKYAQPK